MSVIDRLAAALADRYRIERELGQGGMATVYLAHDLKHERQVAIKVLKPELAAGLGHDRFLREIATTANLRHPHILPLFDSGTVLLDATRGDPAALAEVGGGGTRLTTLLYYVMPFVAGESLRDRLTREKQLSLDDALRITREVADALSHAHSRGVIHRDIKPENILLEAGHAVVADFGIARAVDAAGEGQLTETGLAIGTPTYMSPEQSAAETLDARSDLYSLGSVLYEMLTGEPPYSGPSAKAVIAKRMIEPVPRVTTLRDSVPAAVEAALLRALAKSPADRFATVEEFARALEQSSTISATSSSSTPRWRRLVIGTAIAAMALTALWVGSRVLSGDDPVVASATDRNNVVAVLPFTVRGAPEFAYLAEGLVDLLSGKLDGAGPLRLVDPRGVIGRLGDRDLATLDLTSSAQTAGSLGAGRFITGQLVALPGRVTLSARMHSTDAPTADAPMTTVEGSADSLGQLVDALATQLLAGSLSGANARIQRSAAQSTRSLPATKEFLRGEQFHRRGQFDSASAAYNRALALDSTFALAHLMKSMNNAYTYDTDDYLAAVAAERFSTNLPERDRGIILAFLDQQSGRLASAEQRLIAHLQRYPDEVKALLQLGMLYNRANPRKGRPIEQSRAYFERVLALEPDNVPALHHLARLDAGARFADSLPMRAEALERIAPNTEWAVDVRTMAIVTSGDSEPVQRFIETYPDQTVLARLYGAYNAMRFAPDPHLVDQLLARLRTSGQASATGLPDAVAIDADFSRLIEVLAHLKAGRYNALRDFLQDPTRRRTPTWDVYDAELVALGLVPVDTTTLAQVLARVRAVEPEERLRTKFEPLHDIFTPAVATLERDVTIAKLLAMQGKFEEAWTIQRRLAALPPFTAWESLRDDAAIGLAAELHYLAGDRAQALDLLRTLRFEVPQTANSLAITAGSHARYRRAQLERELGDRDVALQYYDGLVRSFTGSDKFFLAEAYEALGRIHEAAGRDGEAIYWYQRYVRARENADASLMPMRDVMVARLDALRRDAKGEKPGRPPLLPPATESSSN